MSGIFTALDACFVLFLFLQGDHVTHLENVSEEEMNRLLGIVLDVEYLYTCVHKEEDADTKQVYFSLFKVSLWFYNQNIHTGVHNPLFVHVNTPLFCFFSPAVEEIHPTDG